MRRKSALTTLLLLLALFALANPKDSLRLEQKNGVKYIVHRVGKSETIAAIATRYSVSESEILSSNALVSDRVYPGQIVKIPLNENKYGALQVKPVEPISASTLPKSVPANDASAQNPSSSKDLSNVPFKTYVVASPQTVQHLAESFLMDPKDIIELNNLKNNNLKEGQKVKIPLRTEPTVAMAKAEPKPAPVTETPKVAVEKTEPKPVNKIYHEGVPEKPYIEKKPTQVAKVEPPKVTPTEPPKNESAKASIPVAEPISKSQTPVAKNIPEPKPQAAPIAEATKPKPEPKVQAQIIEPPKTQIAEAPKQEPKPSPIPKVAETPKPKQEVKVVPPVAEIAKPVIEQKPTTQVAAQKPIPPVKSNTIPQVAASKGATPAKPIIKDEPIDLNDDSMVLLVMKKQRKKEQLNRLDSEYIHPNGVAYKVFDYKQTDYQFDVHSLKMSEENAIDVNTVSQRKGQGDKNTTHMVKYGETLQSIAKKYKVSATDIINWNGLLTYRVREGQDLIVNAARAEIAPYERTLPKRKESVLQPAVKYEFMTGLAYFDGKKSVRGVYANNIEKGKFVYIINKDNFREDFARVIGPLPKGTQPGVILILDDVTASELKVDKSLINVELYYGFIDQAAASK